MALSNELVSQFAKVVNANNSTKKTETTVYGTVKIDGDKKTVQLDGSNTGIPLESTTDVQNGDRVTVMIKNHTAVVTGNLSAPSINKETTVDDKDGKPALKISELGVVIADKVNAKELQAEMARIDTLYTDVLNVQKVEVEGEMVAKSVVVEDLKAKDAKFDKVATDVLDATFVEVNGELKAKSAVIEKLQSDKADITWANIDFANIDKAVLGELYASSGIIQNVTTENSTVTGELVGVTIKGDLIEAGTLKADSLIIKDKDGLYYKLNFESGNFANAEEVPTDGIHGSAIIAKTITATQIQVSDLVAFGATIGGFKITDNSIFSDVKDDEGNTTRGIYMDTDGQINFGDTSNFIKYYKDEEGNYKLAISAESILYSLNGDSHSVSDLGLIGEYVKISTYEDEPCIELGEKYSDFKLIITNTRIMFMDGSTIPAHIDNQSLHIETADIENELRFGDFAWQKRSNGNMGLLWKGVED